MTSRSSSEVKRSAAEPPPLAVRIAEHPALVWGAVVALAGLASLVVLPPIRNGDFAWHLALGRWIETTQSIPTTEPFTYTAFGAPMVAHEWLSQWLYWRIAEGFGVLALRLAHAAAVAAFVIGAFLGMRRAQVPPALALLGVVLVVAAALDRFQVRPHLVNLGFGLALYVAAFVERPRLTGAQILGFSAAVALWANLHSGAVLFPALLFGYAVVDAIDRRVLRRSAFDANVLGAEPRRVWLLTVACAAALFATPNHVRLVPYLVKSGSVNAGHSVEWLSILRVAGEPGFARDFGAWLLAVVAALAAAAFVARERRQLAPVAVALVCALAPLQSVRFSWLAFAPLLFAFSELGRWLARQPVGTRSRATICASALACLAIPWLAWPGEGLAARIALARDGPPFAPSAFPLRSAQILDELRSDDALEGRLFARAEWGGYLNLALDGHYLVFADGRWVTIGEEIVRVGHQIATGRDQALELADDFDLDILVVERDWLETDTAARDREWLVAFAGYNSQIWLRRGAVGQANRERFARYYAARGIPFNAERGFDPFEAWNANHGWARTHGVRRKHVRHFAEDGSGRRSELGREVVDWEQRRPSTR